MAKVKPKMIYASSKDELKKRLVGIACEIQGSDQGDIEYDEVCAPRLMLAGMACERRVLLECRLPRRASGRMHMHAFVAFGQHSLLLGSVESPPKC